MKLIFENKNYKDKKNKYRKFITKLPVLSVIYFYNLSFACVL